MPSVMGREFPYSPEGMAAAQQYSQALGMRDGGMMGFRPVGMQAGGVPGVNPLVATGMGARAARAGAGAGADVRNATQRGVSAVMGAPVDAVNVALGAVGSGATTPVGGAESISNAIDTVAALIQQFTAQGIPEPVKTAVNAAIGTYGIPVDLVNSALGAIGVPVSDNPIGGSRNLTETFGMRDGGMMGFRPVRMQAGGVPGAEVPSDVAAIFQGLVDVARSGSPQEVAAYIKANREDLYVIASMLPQGQADFVEKTLNSFAAPSTAGQPMQGIYGTEPNFPTSGSPIANEVPLPGYQLPEMRGMKDFPGYEPETGDFYPPPEGEQTPIPVPMNRGGIMSLGRM